MVATITAGFRERLAEMPPLTRTAWLWDILTGAFAGLYQGAVWTFVLRIARADMHATGAQMAWMSAAPALGYIFATIWARQMEGRSKLPFVYWTWLCARGMFLFAPLIHTRTQYVALVCVTPIIFSISTPAYTATMKDIYPDRHRGRLMSTVRIVMNILTLATSLTVGRMLDLKWMDYHAAFFIGGVFGALTAYTFSRIPLPKSEEPPAAKVSAGAFLWDTVDILRRNPGYRWFTASVFVSGFGNIVATTIYPIYQVDRFHITNTQVANLQNITSIATIISFFFWGHFLDQKGPLLTVLVALGINAITPFIYALAGDFQWLYLASIATGLAVSGVDLAYINTTLMFAERGKAAQYQALHSSFFGIRGSIAPQFAIPWMHAYGARGTYWISLAIIMVGVMLQLISMRDFRRQAAEESRRERSERELVTAGVGSD